MNFQVIGNVCNEQSSFSDERNPMHQIKYIHTFFIIKCKTIKRLKDTWLINRLKKGTNQM